MACLANYHEKHEPIRVQDFAGASGDATEGCFLCYALAAAASKSLAKFIAYIARRGCSSVLLA